MSLTLLKETFALLSATPIGHFTLDHLFFIQPILEKINPSVIWEFGFNAGNSAAIWLCLTNAKVFSVDPSVEKYTLDSEMELIQKFGESRFKLYRCSSQQPELFSTILENKPDMVLVDGDHSYDGCLNDLKLCAEVKTPNIILDNLEDGQILDALKNFLQTNPEYTLVDKAEAQNTQIGWLRRSF
jgi:cephalosporin hydroxylase